MKKFICVRGWQRNPTGEVIEEWQYNKLPDEVKSRNFKEVVPDEVVETKAVPKVEPVIESIAPPKTSHTRFKPFNVDEVSSKDEE